MDKSPSSWDQYYDFELNWFVHARNVLNHLPFMRAIRRLRPRTLLEIGSGTGSMSIFLSYLFPHVVSLDIGSDIVRRCQSSNRRLKGRASFQKGDGFNLDRYSVATFDVVFSQGLLEHFSDRDIARLLREQARVARHIVFSVPNDRYPGRDYGDERLLSKESWDALVRRSGLHLVESRQYAKFLRRRKLMYLAVATASESGASAGSHD